MAHGRNTPSFSLNDREMAFISSMVAAGRFGNRTEVARAGLRLLEDYENDQKLKRLRAMIDEADADIAAGRVHEYANATELAHRIIERGRARLKATD